MAKWRRKCENCIVGNWECVLVKESDYEGFCDGREYIQFTFCPICGVEINPEEPPHPEIEREVNSLL